MSVRPKAIIEIREELPEDWDAIHEVNERAFGQAGEANLVRALRNGGAVTLSLVAIAQSRILGHILFSPVTIQSGNVEFSAIGLAPLAVAPQGQGQGIGAQLVEKGIQLLRERSHPAVVVLGHPDYYPRFGFTKASLYKISWEFDAPEEAFMLLELVPGSLPAAGGVVQFHPAFLSV